MFAHSRSRSSGCCRTTLTAAATLATFDGDAGRGEHIRAGKEVQRSQLRVVRHADAANARERFREGADDEIDLIENALLFGAAQAGRAIRAERMCLVDQQVRAVRAAHFDDLAQRRHVAADRIQTLTTTSRLR